MPLSKPPKPLLTATLPSGMIIFTGNPGRPAEEYRVESALNQNSTRLIIARTRNSDSRPPDRAPQGPLPVALSVLARDHIRHPSAGPTHARTARTSAGVAIKGST